MFLCILFLHTLMMNLSINPYSPRLDILVAASRIILSNYSILKNQLEAYPANFSPLRSTKVISEVWFKIPFSFVLWSCCLGRTCTKTRANFELFSINHNYDIMCKNEVQHHVRAVSEKNVLIHKKSHNVWKVVRLFTSDMCEFMFVDDFCVMDLFCAGAVKWINLSWCHC